MHRAAESKKVYVFTEGMYIVPQEYIKRAPLVFFCQKIAGTLLSCTSKFCVLPYPSSLNVICLGAKPIGIEPNQPKKELVVRGMVAKKGLG
jgi:hypothetical protein